MELPLLITGADFARPDWRERVETSPARHSPAGGRISDDEAEAWCCAFDERRPVFTPHNVVTLRATDPLTTVASRVGSRRVEAPLEEHLGPRNKKKPEAKRIEVMWPGEYVEPDQNWLVKHVLLEQGEGLWSGGWGTIKTFGLLDLAHALAGGSDQNGQPRTHWLGGKINERCAMFMFAAERPFAIFKRLRARGLHDGSLPFAWAKECPPLLNPKNGTMNEKSVEEICRTLKAANEEMLRKHDVRIGVAAFDTLSRCAQYPQGGESDNSCVQGVMTALTAITNECGLFSLATDHMGLTGGRSRGASSKDQWAGTVFLSYGDDGVGHVEIEKVSEDEAGKKFGYKLDVIVLGQDRDHEDITSCVVEWGDYDQGSKAKKPTEMQAKLLASLEGRTLPTSAEEVRNSFKDKHGGATRTANEAFRRAVADLKLEVTETGLLQRVDDPYRELF